ncbi:MAG: Leupeptin-inactivating enzyme 1, partial [Planctomycetota bacterium]
GNSMFGVMLDRTSPVIKKPEYDNFQVYFNLDNGTGKIRGVHLQGNELSRSTFRKWLHPFADLEANTITANNTGGTDHLSFDAIGLPGFQFIQDEIEYDPRTHHSNMDVYDRLQADDLKQASTIMASLVWQAANMDERFPRKPTTRKLLTEDEAKNEVPAKKAE